MNLKKKTQSGFTLIELLVVVIILGVLSALAMPVYSSMVRRAKYSEAKQQMGVIAREAKLYLVENGSYPPDVDPDIQPAGVENWPNSDPNVGEVPFSEEGTGSHYDYDHWGVGGNQCYVQVGFTGENGVRNYPQFTINRESPGFEELGDDLILSVALYSCSRGAGSVK